MSSPYDTDSARPGQPGQPGPEPGPSGPRVTRDEVRDLAALRRSRTDRKVSGVAGGVARHLDIDPLLVRVAFVILTFFGGGGLILYAVAWILVPEEDTGDTVIHTEDGVRTAALIIAGVLAGASVIGDSLGGMDVPWPLMVVGLVLVVVLGGKQAKDRHFGGQAAVAVAAPDAGPGADAGADAGISGGGPTYPGYRPGPPPPPRPAEPRRRGPLLFPFTVALAAFALGVLGTLHLAGLDVAPSAYPATVLGVVGLMLLVGAFYGRAGGLIVVGLAAAALTAVLSVTDGLDMGEIRERPDTAAELSRSYDLDVGDIRIDLTDLSPDELESLDGTTLEVDLDIGHIRVIVPDDGLRVEADGSIEVGEVVLFGKKSGDTDSAVHGGGDEPVLTVDADMVVGQIEVITEEDAA